MTILLVDSDKAALERETRRLKEQQFAASVSLYSSADDAIRYALYHDVDIVFTRAVLDGMPGQALVDKIREQKPNTECYILGQDEDVPYERLLKAPRPLHTAQAGSAAPGCQGMPEEKSYPGQRKELTPPPPFEKRGRQGDRTMTNQELRSLNRKELLEIMLEQAKELETCKQQYEKDLGFLKSEYEKNMEFLKAEQEKTTALLKTGYEDEIAALKAEHEAEVATLKAEHGAEAAALKSEHKAETAALKAEHEAEAAALKKKLQEAQQALKSRELSIHEAGSIAMAALQVNGVFEAAQAASQMYIENIRALNERQEVLFAQREEESKAEMERQLRETRMKCADMELACKKKCAAMMTDAKQRSETYWIKVAQRLQGIYHDNKGLKRFLDLGTSGGHV